MKYINEILTAVSVITLLGAVSCNKEKAVEGAGSAIRFGVSTVYENGPATKTEYSGKDQNNNSISSTSTAERIDWVEGDFIRIVSPQATVEGSSEKKYADYAITPKTDASTATIDPVSSGLQWGGEVSHNFFALYPCPEKNGSAGIAANGTAGARITGTVPAEQSATLSSDHVFKPDMNYAYMYAYASVTSGSSVQLEFHPLVTTLEFKLLTKEDDPITSNLISVKLSSTQSDAYLAGSFPASLTTSGLTPVDISNISGESNVITIELPGDGVPLSTSEAYTVTFLMLPMDQTELTLTLNFAGDITRTLELKDNDAWITVPARRKTYIWNLAVPAQVGDTDTSVGEFTVNAEGKKVGFARANLKYTGNGNGTGTWSIMDNPWDVVETDGTVADNYGHSATSWETISLFGWGTSGNGDDTRSDPWRTDTDYLSYGPNGAYDLTGDNFKYDWASNSISGLGGSNWRTPSRAEWNYILSKRSSLVDHSYTLAVVAEMNGLVIFPDGFDFSSSPFSFNFSYESYSSNSIVESDWAALEAKGCVFLPAAGSRRDTDVDGVGNEGIYWSSTVNNTRGAYGIYFDDEYVTNFSGDRNAGYSVRLVREL